MENKGTSKKMENTTSGTKIRSKWLARLFLPNSREWEENQTHWEQKYY